MKRLTDYGTFYEDKREEPVFGAPKQPRAKNGTSEERMPRVVMPRGEAAPPQQPQHYAPAPRGRRLAEEAALAAQHVLDVEEELQQTRAERDDERINREVSDRENGRLKADLANKTRDFEERIERITAERDKHRDRVVYLESQFASVATLLVEIVNPEANKRRHDAVEPREPAPDLDAEFAKLVAADHEAPRRD